MKRSSAADALLWAPGQQRLSLTVLANHTVDKVHLDQSLRANGVRFSPTLSKHTKQQFTVKAAKSVILAAGTLATAPILERSGVGKASILSAARVKQTVDLPGVGANLNVCQHVLLFIRTILVMQGNTNSPYCPPSQDQFGTSTSALVKKEYQNDTSLIDGRKLFAPEISLVNIDNIWSAGKTRLYTP